MNLAGETFGKLLVLDCKEQINGKTYWLCQCECQTQKLIRIDHLKKVKSCGCERIKSGLSRTRIGKIYYGMIRRCYSEKHQQYKDYGGRGIIVCKEWFGEDGITIFHDWAINNGYSSELTIDRMNNDKMYCPENCRWATKSEQAINRRPKGANKQCKH